MYAYIKYSIIIIILLRILIFLMHTFHLTQHTYILINIKEMNKNNNNFIYSIIFTVVQKNYIYKLLCLDLHILNF